MRRLAVGFVAVLLVACGSGSGDIRTADTARSSKTAATSVPDSHRAEFCRLLERLDSASSSRQLRIVAKDLGTLAGGIEDDKEAFGPWLRARNTGALCRYCLGQYRGRSEEPGENAAIC